MTPEEALRILELEPGATPEAVQEAYRKAALRTPPDRADGYGLHDKKAWLKVRDAYECLREAGFQCPLPAPAPEEPKAPKRYKAPDWLERKWANEQGDRLSEHFRMDEHERHALRQTLVWLFMVFASGILAFVFYQKYWKPGHISPRPGVSVSW